MTDLQEKSKGILDIGSHCHECHNVDFLPFKCDVCEFEFCQNHRTPESHGCVRRQVSSSPKPPSASSSTSKKQIPKAPPSQPAAQKQKPAASPPPQQEKNATVERLKAFWARKKSSLGSSGPGSAKPKNRFVQMAELKKTAKGDPPSTPQQNRLYLTLERPAHEYKDPITNSMATRPAKRLNVYFDKGIVVGRLLDRACVHLDVTNKNNNTQQDKLGLYKMGEFLPYSVKLSELLQDGDTVVLR